MKKWCFIFFIFEFRKRRTSLVWFSKTCCSLSQNIIILAHFISLHWQSRGNMSHPNDTCIYTNTYFHNALQTTSKSIYSCVFAQHPPLINLTKTTDRDILCANNKFIFWTSCRNDSDDYSFWALPANLFILIIWVMLLQMMRKFQIDIL